MDLPSSSLKGVMYARAQKELYAHIWVETRVDGATGRPAADIFISGSDRVRIPGLRCMPGMHLEVCLSRIKTYTRAVDLDFGHAGVLDEWAGLCPLRAAVRGVSVLRRLDPPVVPYPTEDYLFDHAVDVHRNSLPRIDAPTEVFLYDLDADSQPTAAKQIPLLHSAQETAVVVIRFTHGKPHCRDLLHLLFTEAPSVVFIIQPLDDRLQEGGSEIREVLTQLVACSTVRFGAEPDRLLERVPSVTIRPRDTIVDYSTGPVSGLFVNVALDRLDGFSFKIATFRELADKVGQEELQWVMAP